MSERRFWFHCSNAWRGERWTAVRRAPAGAGPSEPPVPRLCVASSVARCFAARLFSGDVFVYRTATPRRTVKPKNVWDATITGERWIIPPVDLVLDCVVQANQVERALGKTRQRVDAKIREHDLTSIDDMIRKRAGITPVERILGFREILCALDKEFTEPRDFRFVSAALRALKVEL